MNIVTMLETWNAYVCKEGRVDECILLAEELDFYLIDESPSEIVRMVAIGDYRPNDRYIWVKNGALYSANELDKTPCNPAELA